MLIFKSEKAAKKTLIINLSEQEREARYICENVKAFLAVWVLLRAFLVLLAPFFVLLAARGCLLGASWVPFGRLLGPPGRLLGPLWRLLGPLGAIFKLESEFGPILAPQRVPKGSQK